MATCSVIVDLSHFNQNPDFQQASAAGIIGVIHKATQGIGFVDPTYGPHRTAASAAGLLWGAYHFGTGDDPVAQAQHFVQVAAPGPQDILVLDFEENTNNSNNMTLDQARAFVGAVQNATGITPGLYGGAYLREQLGNSADPVLQACWLWWAQYGPLAPVIPANWATWTLWQYTDGHNGNPQLAPFTVAGIGPCDRDQYQGTIADLAAKWVTGSLA